jgi:hypothetical protein
MGDWWLKPLKGKLLSIFRQPGDQLNRTEWQPKSKSQHTNSQRMLKRWDIADEDYEVRTIIATDPGAESEEWRTFCMNPEFVVRSEGGGVWFSPYTSMWGGGAGNRLSLQEFRFSVRPSHMIKSKQDYQLFVTCDDETLIVFCDLWRYS